MTGPGKERGTGCEEGGGAALPFPFLSGGDSRKHQPWVGVTWLLRDDEVHGDREGVTSQPAPAAWGT